MSTVLTDDRVNIAYRIHGDGPRNVLLLHGWAGSGNYFEPLVSAMDLAGVRVITVDYRCHGESDKVSAGHTLERYAQDVLQVAEEVRAQVTLPCWDSA